MQLARQVTHGGRYLFDPPQQFLSTGGGVRLGGPLAEQFHLHRQQGEVLA